MQVHFNEIGRNGVYNTIFLIKQYKHSQTLEPLPKLPSTTLAPSTKVLLWLVYFYTSLGASVMSVGLPLGSSLSIESIYLRTVRSELESTRDDSMLPSSNAGVLLPPSFPCNPLDWELH